MSAYLCGIDIGGTFTDCVAVDEEGRVVTGKAPSTPANFADGLIAALEIVAGKLDLPLETLLRRTAMLAHGTTVGTNAIIQKKGVKVGLITTKGHNDVIHIMRGSRGLTGRDIRRVVHIPESSKPDPIVPKYLIEGVSERVDCFGRVVVELNEAEAERAIRRLVAEGADALAICFLWSFLAPAHEQRVQAMVREIAPDLFVTCSSDLVPKWGEYERTAAVALNAYIGPLVTGYLADLDARTKTLGYRHPLQITQCAGGTIPVSKAMEAPLLTLDSGPVSGVTGSSYAAAAMGHENVITTDMGGTSFDVGVIHGGAPAFSYRSLVHQYEYYLSKVDIQAIGAGGGSMARIDETTGTFRVGPESAGADPGPVCYGRGGTVPTVTDADLVLGYLDPENFAGGTIRLDRDAAAETLAALGAQAGLGVDETADGIARIVEFQMADLIRKTTIQKGHDPRDFVLFAFGGAGPVHAGVFARELGVSKVIVPQRESASVWCAFGAAAADLLHVYERVNIQRSPFAAEPIRTILEDLKAQGESDLAADDVPAADRRFRFTVDMRHKGQINEVEVELGGETDAARFLDRLHGEFRQRYEALYGKGSALPGAQLEIVTFRCRASGETRKPRLSARRDEGASPPADARRAPRGIYWSEWGRRAETPIFDGARLRPGNRIEGPAAIDTEVTTVVVHPGQSLAVDAYGNFEIAPGAA